ncbi:histidine ammonia-lyase [Nocardia vulneris]|uniref:Histidine ammonia-lyase n=1 Tax=Nocardia vulneris TaxID=1141657 RepID=A0ABR4ZLL6_9NOCA|nr:histidine ammonia-lyase [Nocardia vulneris]KIA65985.1 histidine ammonia-lyase [Nocardia vulneris]
MTIGTRQVLVGTTALTLDDVVAVARHGVPVELESAALQRLSEIRRHIDELAQNARPVYGVTTGFGALERQHIPPERRIELQRSLIRSHAAGAGAPVEPEVVRAMMLLRLRTLMSGRTGVRPTTAAALAALLDSGLIPVVPEHGSLGASGDLAPLAAVALALMGEGSALGAADGPWPGSAGERPMSQALRDYGLTPITLEAKEGLALTNGTDGMLGMLVLAITDLRRLFDLADLAAAMSVEALLGTDRVFAAELQALRPHPGQAVSAGRIHAALAGSQIVASHRGADCPYVQDAYSLRCAPQVHGAARDTLAHAEGVAERELCSAIDNPVILADGRVESNGNFHGAPVAYVSDFLAIAVADVASIAERRTDRLLDPQRSRGLPAFLAADPGVDSGYMIAQYTQAGVVSELKRCAAPASVDSIPTSAMQEDHVSMGWAAARKLRRAVDGLTTVLAIELLTAARALDYRAPLRPAPATAAARDLLREYVPGPGPDRHLAPEIAVVTDLIRSGAIDLRVAYDKPPDGA